LDEETKVELVLLKPVLQIDIIWHLRWVLCAKDLLVDLLKDLILIICHVKDVVALVSGHKEAPV